MKSKAIVTAAALFCAGLIGSTHALAADGSAAERQRLADSVVQKWGGYVANTYKVGADTWSREMAPAFAEASMEELNAAAGAEDFDSVNRLLLGGSPMVAAGEGSSTKAVGDVDRDLVFVPVTPCRLFDTRLAGGQIAANTTRSFDVTAVSDYAFQGGSATNCGGVGAAGSFAAAAINFTVVTPSGAGYITAFPFGGSQPLAATVNYASGAIVGNYAVVKLDQGASANELSVYSFAATHLVADIVGYYTEVVIPAVALECQDTATTNTAVAAGATANSNAPACPVGYTQTATNCESSTWQMPFVYFKSGTCSAQNNSAAAATLRSSRTCCRVPAQ
ncbi:hypothetical protein [Arenimonas sp. MALMAid1274]|uniref:hypothetical protein n=1 Tax=Arenimonas sp. MALMAid1274 TaxID=3411630 RepID=UPI003B9EE462